MRSEVPSVHEVLARAYVKKGDFDDAAAEMKRVIALTPRNEDAYYRLGLIFLQQKQPTKAQDIFSQLLKVDPNSVEGHAGLANVFADQHQNLAALNEYKRVAAADPGYQSVNYNMGVMEARLNLYDDAIASLLKQRQNGDDADNENLLAEVYAAKGMKSEADDARRRAGELQASH